MSAATSTELMTGIANADTALTLGGFAVVGAGLSISIRSLPPEVSRPYYGTPWTPTSLRDQTWP